MPVTEQFLLERAGALGGSDMPALLNLAPFGCTRRLWYDKRGHPRDFLDMPNRHMIRGTQMEPFAVREYEHRTGREVSPIAPGWKAHPMEPRFGVHADRIQLIDERIPEQSILEVKCPSARYYFAVRAKPDPPAEAALQLQWGMSMWDMSWGTVVLFCADQWDLRYWDVPADKEMQDRLLEIGQHFLLSLEGPLDPNPYTRLEKFDPRCASCPWRATCQGLGENIHDVDRDVDLASTALDVIQLENPKMVAEAIRAYLLSRRIVNDAQAVHELHKLRLQELFPHEGKILTDVGQARLTTVHRKGYEVKPTKYLSLRVQPKVEEFLDAAESISDDI